VGESLNLKYSGALILRYLGVPCLILGIMILIVLLSIPGRVFAQEEPSECVEMGALAYDNWSTGDAGGSGMPTGESDNDYLKCKACHGWDRLATKGGYVRRSMSDGRAAPVRPTQGQGTATRQAASSALIGAAMNPSQLK